MFNRILFFVALVLLGSMLHMCSRLDASETQYDQQTSVIRAAGDSVRYYRDHYNRVVAEKTVMAANLDVITKSAKLLTPNQNALVQDIKHMPKKVQKSLVTASSVEQVVSVIAHENVDSTALVTHTWSLRSDTLSYTIYARGDTLRLDSLSIPNRLVLAHYVGKDEALHVTATNTNPMFKTLDVDAIVPPAKKPSKLVKIILTLLGFGSGYYVAR